MPNLKIYVDDGLYPELRGKLEAALEPARSLLCRGFGVGSLPASSLWSLS